jgi:hypothetical protein
MKPDDVISARLDAIEADIAALKAAIAPIKSVAPTVIATPQAPVKPEGVRIINVIERCPIAIPTAAEYRKILPVVFGSYPKIQPDWSNPQWAQEDEAEFFREFCAAFERVARLRRTARSIKSMRSHGGWTIRRIRPVRCKRPGSPSECRTVAIASPARS